MKARQRKGQDPAAPKGKARTQRKHPRGSPEAAAQSVASKPGMRGPDPAAARTGAIHKLGEITEHLHALAAVRVTQVGDSTDPAAVLIRQAAQHAARARLVLQGEALQQGDPDA